MQISSMEYNTDLKTPQNTPNVNSLLQLTSTLEEQLKSHLATPTNTPNVDSPIGKSINDRVSLLSMQLNLQQLAIENEQKHLEELNKQLSNLELNEEISNDTDQQDIEYDERDKVVNEIIDTEVTYVSSLKTLDNVSINYSSNCQKYYIHPLKEESENLSFSLTDQLASMFNALKKIIDIHSSLLRKMLNLKHPNTQNVTRILLQSLLDVEFKKVYSEYFLNYTNWTRHIRTLMSVEEFHKLLAEFEKNCKTDGQGLDIFSYLVI